jgi:hypothetical protein
MGNMTRELGRPRTVLSLRPGVAETTSSIGVINLQHLRA